MVALWLVEPVAQVAPDVLYLCCHYLASPRRCFLGLVLIPVEGVSGQCAHASGVAFRCADLSPVEGVSGSHSVQFPDQIVPSRVSPGCICQNPVEGISGFCVLMQVQYFFPVEGVSGMSVLYPRRGCLRGLFNSLSCRGCLQDLLG